jgi:hypothetical protein
MKQIIQVGTIGWVWDEDGEINNGTSLLLLSSSSSLSFSEEAPFFRDRSITVVEQCSRNGIKVIPQMETVVVAV